MSIRLTVNKTRSAKIRVITIFVMLPILRFIMLVFSAGVFITGLADHAGAKKPLFEAYRQIIAIDPGHGGNDVGATGPGGNTEKAVSLRFARILASELERRYKVVLTRTADSPVDLETRTALANHHRAHLLISIHTGGSMISGTAGILIYHYQDFSEDSLTRSDEPPTPLHQSGSALVWEQVQSRFGKKAGIWPTASMSVSTS